MRKRLRKKLHRGEYAINGVSLRTSFARQLDPEEFDQFIDDFIEHAMEARGLSFGGGGHPASGWNGVIQPKRGDLKIHEVDLEYIRAWLGDHDAVDSFELSDSWDIYYGMDPHENEHVSDVEQA